MRVKTKKNKAPGTGFESEVLFFHCFSLGLENEGLGLDLGLGFQY